jgi:hypothetical protein
MMSKREGKHGRTGAQSAPSKQQPSTETETQPAIACQKCQDDEENREDLRRHAIEDANRLAEFMENPGVAMDIWDLVGSTLADLAASAGVGFHTPEVVRAAVPHIVVTSESRDMISSLLSAIDKLRQADARVVHNDDVIEERPPAPDVNSDEWTHHPAFREISNERAAQLVDTILAQDNDEQARAFIELVAAVAYEKDFAKRDDLAAGAIRHAFGLTMDSSQAANDFCLRVPRN